MITQSKWPWACCKYFSFTAKQNTANISAVDYHL